jgi:hypothetical protein
MFRKCSTRDYAGAIEDAIEGYGTAKICASRHFQQASAKQLQDLMEREVPKDLLALMVDAKHFADQCLVVALGITAEGKNRFWACGKDRPRTRRWSRAAWGSPKCRSYPRRFEEMRVSWSAPA